MARALPKMTRPIEFFAGVNTLPNVCVTNTKESADFCLENIACGQEMDGAVILPIVYLSTLGKFVLYRVFICLPSVFVFLFLRGVYRVFNCLPDVTMYTRYILILI